jgi:pectate lyase
MNKRILFGVLILLIVLHLTYTNHVFAQSTLPAFPGAEGYGAQTIGGRGGKVLIVNTLNDSTNSTCGTQTGTCSLRDCINASGSRTCVFSVGGTIVLGSSIELSKPFITIAGQTAPGGGILLRANGGSGDLIHISTHDVILRYITFRRGPPTDVNDTDDLSIYKNNSTDVYNIIVDHCSMSWTNDRILYSWYGPHDFTIQWSLFTEPLRCNRNKKGCDDYNAKSVMLGSGKLGESNSSPGATNITFHHNLIADGDERNPLVKPAGIAEIINNVIYNVTSTYAHLDADLQPNQFYVNFIGNYFRSGGPSGKSASPYGIKLSLTGVLPDKSKSMTIYTSPHEKNPTGTALVYPVTVSTCNKDPLLGGTLNCDVYQKVILDQMSGNNRGVDAHGTYFIRQDAVDRRIFQDVIQKKGKIINAPGPTTCSGETSTCIYPVSTDYTDYNISASDIASDGWPVISTNLPYAAYTDTDKDGISDIWETEQFGTLTRSSSTQSSSDYDQDGYTDLEEYINGTNPKDNDLTTTVTIIPTQSPSLPVMNPPTLSCPGTGTTTVSWTPQNGAINYWVQVWNSNNTSHWYYNSWIGTTQSTIYIANVNPGDSLTAQVAWTNDTGYSNVSPFSQTSTIQCPYPTSTPIPQPTGTISRSMKYYLVDRVRSNSDFALLASWGINTAIVDFKVSPQSDSPSVWDGIVNAATNAGIKIVIWPDGHQGSDVSGCRWETPFDDDSIGGGSDYLINIKSILDRYGNNPNVIGIVTAHEPTSVESGSQDRCSENIADMTAIKTQIHNYIDNTIHRNSSYSPFKVWNYIDNIYKMSSLGGYSSTNKQAQIAGIMDVAVIWQHCAGYPTYQGDGTACEGSSQYTALGGLNYDRNLIKNNNLEGIVEEAFLIQTFHQGTSGDYAGKFTLTELQNYSSDFINSKNLDGFGYYTWDEGWYTGNLKKYTDLQPAVSYIYNNFIAITPVSPTVTQTPTFTPIPTIPLTPTNTSIPSPTSPPNPLSYRFGSISDAHVETINFNNTVTQLLTSNPNFILFNGDLENDGVNNSEMDPIIGVLENKSVLSKTFSVRGNHDDHVSGSATLWENYFENKLGSPRVLPSGATNYVSLNSMSDTLTYSFDYGNSIFIGLDSNQYADPPTNAQLTFLDTQLTNAENRGLTHAFIFTHPPEYCVESTHCSCQTKTGCGPSTSFINIINKHPIVSATIHGHEHILAWTHMDSTRVPQLTHPYEEFFTSSSGNPYSFTPYPSRMDYYNFSASQTAYAVFDVQKENFTVNYYHTGTSTPLKTLTFSKGVEISPSPTLTPIPTPTPTPFLAPEPITISNQTSDSTFVSWTPISGANVYFFQASLYDTTTSDGGYSCTLGQINCGPSEKGDPTTNGWISQTFSYLSNLMCNTTYFVHVKAGLDSTQIPGTWTDPHYSFTLPCPTNTPTSTPTFTPIPTPTLVPSMTTTPTHTPTPTPTRTPTPTSTPTKTPTPTSTATPTMTPTLIPTVTPSITPTYTPTPTPTIPTVFSFDVSPVTSTINQTISLTFSRSKVNYPVDITVSIPSGVEVPGITGCNNIPYTGCTFTYTMQGQEVNYIKEVYPKEAKLFLTAAQFVEETSGNSIVYQRSFTVLAPTATPTLYPTPTSTVTPTPFQPTQIPTPTIAPVGSISGVIYSTDSSSWGHVTTPLCSNTNQSPELEVYYDSSLNSSAWLCAVNSDGKNTVTYSTPLFLLPNTQVIRLVPPLKHRCLSWIATYPYSNIPQSNGVGATDGTCLLSIPLGKNGGLNNNESGTKLQFLIQPNPTPTITPTTNPIFTPTITPSPTNIPTIMPTITLTITPTIVTEPSIISPTPSEISPIPSISTIVSITPTTGHVKLGDLNNDGKIDGKDYVVLIKNLGMKTTKGPLDGDFDRDGVVTKQDVRLFIKYLIHK